jgi:uncharacterized protein (TIGR02646 family)
VIAVQRSAPPTALTRNASKWSTALHAAATRAQEKKALERYRHPEIKKALVELFHGKCAYCESEIVHVDYGHIDHYLPKSGARGRRDLVFDWDNLLLACGVCNGAEWKSDKSPTTKEGGPYVNPCNDDPSSHFLFEYDAVANLASVRGTTPRGVRTEEDLGLNRPELRAHRSKQVRHWMALSRLAGTDPEAKALIQEVKNADGEYAAFARALL